jgi:hypothetical protein
MATLGKIMRLSAARPWGQPEFVGYGHWRLRQRGQVVGECIDGKALVLEAKEQIVLRCGKASITLTRAGKVLVQGAYLSSRSTGLNRIKGGAVG